MRCGNSKRSGRGRVGVWRSLRGEAEHAKISGDNKNTNSRACKVPSKARLAAVFEILGMVCLDSSRTRRCVASVKETSNVTVKKFRQTFLQLI